MSHVGRTYGRLHGIHSKNHNPEFIGILWLLLPISNIHFNHVPIYSIWYLLYLNMFTRVLFILKRTGICDRIINHRSAAPFSVISVSKVKHWLPKLRAASHYTSSVVRRIRSDTICHDGSSQVIVANDWHQDPCDAPSHTTRLISHDCI